MRIVFYAEDASAAHAALLAARAVTPDEMGHVLVTTCPAEGADFLAEAKARKLDAFLALPLQAMCDQACRKMAHLSVVVPTLDEPSPRRSLAAIDELAAEGPDLAPVWLLARNGNHLRHAAGKARALPVLLRQNQVAQSALPLAARLGAALALAVSDPFAPCLDPRRLRDAFTGSTASDLDLRARLVGFAALLESDSPSARMRPASRTHRRHKRTGARGRIGVFVPPRPLTLPSAIEPSPSHTAIGLR